MRTHVIVNTTAKLYRTTPTALGDLERASAGRAEIIATKTLSELDEACRRIAEQGTDCVALSGGDGTFMAGLTALTGAFAERARSGTGGFPRLALLPGGTVATVARNWGSTGPAPALLARLLRDGTGARVSPRPTLRVTDDAGSRVGFIFGTGLVARFFGVYYEAGAGGQAGAARIVARVFAESFYGGSYARRVLDPLPCTIDVDGRRLVPEAWSLICCSVVRDVGLHLLVNHRAGEDFERPHLVASALSPTRLGPRMPYVLAGKSIGGEHHFDDLVRTFTVRFGNAGGPYVLDGDVFRSTSVTVGAGPAIDVVRFGLPTKRVRAARLNDELTGHLARSRKRAAASAAPRHFPGSSASCACVTACRSVGSSFL